MVGQVGEERRGEERRAVASPGGQSEREEGSRSIPFGLHGGASERASQPRAR